MSLEWVLHPPTSLLAQQLRRDIRARRREGPGGHRFVYGDLRLLWAAEHHVLLSHYADLSWQHWAHHSLDQGWLPIGAYIEFEEAKAAAEFHEWEPEWPAPKVSPGTYVLSGWPRENDGDVIYTMRVRCHTKNTAIAVADWLRNLRGCAQNTKRSPVTSYADKRPKAECADPRCVEPGTTLAVEGGRVDWWCQKHAAMMEQTSPTR